MTNEIKASFTLCDRMNPGFGYQLHISRRHETLLWTSKAPDTGNDLLTAADCMRVIAMYIPTETTRCPDSHCELPPGHAGAHRMGLYVRMPG